jgi:hypothetical protein
VRDFSIAHTFPGGDKGQGFQLMEMGPNGTGSLEHGDASGELFWMPYPLPFLPFYYNTFPEEKPADPSAPKPAVPEVTDLTSPAKPVSMPDVHPDFPHLRLSNSAPVWKSWSVNSDKLVEMGPKAGMFCAEFECIIDDGSGCCGTKRKMYHVRNRAVSTSNLITHMREKAKTCDKHAEAVKMIDAASRNVVEIDGNSVLVFNFSEAFCHYVDVMWLRAAGMSQYMTEGDAFRDYTRGYETRAAFPDKVTVRQLAYSTAALQKVKRVQKFRRLKVAYKGGACVGIQLDMWWDSNTGTAYAAVSSTTVEEPRSPSPSAQLLLESEIIAFEVFPFCEKTGENIKTWLLQVLQDHELSHDMVSGVTPDGAADGQCALKMISTLAEKVDTCFLYILQRAVKYSNGQAGSVSKNEEAKGQLRLNTNVVTLSNQSGAFQERSKSRSRRSRRMPASSRCRD